MTADAGADRREPPPPRRRCPICGRQPVEAFSPFCSRRCADVDLHRWLGGGYRLPVEPDEASRDASEPE